MTTPNPVSPPPSSGSPTNPGDDTTNPAQLIADNLARLPHPGGTDKARLLMFRTFDTTGLPPDIAKAVNASAVVIGEAIIHLLHTNGYTLTKTTQAET